MGFISYIAGDKEGDPGNVRSISNIPDAVEDARAGLLFRWAPSLIFRLHGADSTSAVQPEPGEVAECGMTYYQMLAYTLHTNPGRTKAAGASGYQVIGWDIAP